MKPLPLRLTPGQDLRRALEAALLDTGCEAAFVICGIGSLGAAQLRFAGREQPQRSSGDLEILTLSGSLAPAASHLHASLADADGRVFGGHVGYGCIVRTTAEVLLAPLDDWTFSRPVDAQTGYPELAIRPRTARGV